VRRQLSDASAASLPLCGSTKLSATVAFSCSDRPGVESDTQRPVFIASETGWKQTKFSFDIFYISASDALTFFFKFRNASIVVLCCIGLLPFLR
jgi:hypothetical protein